MGGGGPGRGGWCLRLRGPTPRVGSSQAEAEAGEAVVAHPEEPESPRRCCSPGGRRRRAGGQVGTLVPRGSAEVRALRRPREGAWLPLGGVGSVCGRTPPPPPPPAAQGDPPAESRAVGGEPRKRLRG